MSDSTGRGCFGYTVTKSGTNASVSPLPEVEKTACKPTPLVNVSQRVSDFKNSGTEIGMSVSLPEASVGLNAPIFFDLKVFNRSARKVGFDLGLNSKANLQLTIWGPGGGVTTRTLSSGGFGLSGKVSLAPGGAFVEKLLLNEWYDFPQPGTYHIKATPLEDSSGASGAANANRPSTAFSLQIDPRDPGQLERICQGLADRAIAATTYEEKEAAANALSYIRDPLAVPSLVRVLQHGSMVENYAVDGLGRIGSPAAIEALIAAQNHPDEDVRAAARSMLGALREGGQGPLEPAD
ncbi:MAG: HEAT repeat domain-containing protein [Methylocella sp.]